MSTNRKKILFIARWYPDRHDPMLGLFVQKHALAVQQLHDVVVLYVTADPFLNPGKVEINEVISEGIHEWRIYFGKHQHEWQNAFCYLWAYFRGLQRIIHELGKPDWSHVHVLSRAAIPALWLKYTSGVPYLITEHWSRYLPENVKKGAYAGWLRRYFTRIAVTASNGVTTVTRNLAEAMQQLGLKNNYHIIPNVADTNLFHPQQKQPKKIKKLIHVSCFDEPAKNICGMIRVVNRLSSKRDDFVFNIVGDGRDFELVKKFAEQEGDADGRIVFHGLLTGEALAAKMREADVLLMFSNYENLPCTIVESICSGVPVISTDVGGIHEYVNEKNGFLIARGDEESLEKVLNDFLDHPDQWDKDVIRREGEKYFSMEVIAAAFDRLYR